MFDKIDKSDKNVTHLEFDYESLKQIVDPNTGVRGGPAVGMVDVPNPNIDHVINGDRLQIRLIDSKYLCTASYQRNINETTVKKMNENSVYVNAFGGRVTCHEKRLWNPNAKRYETFFKVVDGQHQVSVNPGRELFVCVANTVPEDILYKAMNDPKASTQASPTDLFHANSFRDGIEKELTKMAKENHNIRIERHPDHGRGKLKKSERTNLRVFQIGDSLLKSYNHILGEVRKRKGEKPKRESELAKMEAMAILDKVLYTMLKCFSEDDLRTGGGKASCDKWIQAVSMWVCWRFKDKNQEGISIGEINFLSIEKAWKLWKWSEKDRKNSTTYNMTSPRTLRNLTKDTQRILGKHSLTAQSRKDHMLEFIYNAQIVEDRR